MSELMFQCKTLIQTNSKLRFLGFLFSRCAAYMYVNYTFLLGLIYIYYFKPSAPSIIFLLKKIAWSFLIFSKLGFFFNFSSLLRDKPMAIGDEWLPPLIGVNLFIYFPTRLFLWQFIYIILYPNFLKMLRWQVNKQITSSKRTKIKKIKLIKKYKGEKGSKYKINKNLTQSYMNIKHPMKIISLI